MCAHIDSGVLVSSGVARRPYTKDACGQPVDLPLGVETMPVVRLKHGDMLQTPNAIFICLRSATLNLLYEIVPQD